MKKFILILFFSPAVLFAQSKKEISLAYSFKPGQVIEVQQQTVQKISQNIMGMSQESTNEITGSMKYEVKEVSSNGARIEAEFTSLKSKVTSMMGSMAMDSEGDQDVLENKIMKILTGKKFVFTLSNKGVVSDIENSENILSGLDDLGLDAAQLTAMKQNLQQQYTGQGLKGNLESGLVQYAEQRIKPGDEWKSEVHAGLSFPLMTRNTWTLQKQDKSEATIKAKGEIVTTDKDKTFPLQMGMKGKTDLSGEQKVESTLSLQDGWPNSIKSFSIIDGTLTILAGAMLPEDMEVPMKIETESSYTFIRK